jgi:endonuclease YncB( thermonuclease family)
VDLGHVGGDGPYDVKRLILRLSGIDAPEIRTHDVQEKQLAMKSRAHLLNTIAPHLFDIRKNWSCEKDITDTLQNNLVLVYVKIYKQDKYGRQLADIFELPTDKLSLNRWMLDNGFADAYDGGHKERTWEV